MNLHRTESWVAIQPFTTRLASLPAVASLILALMACVSEVEVVGTTDETNTARIVGPDGSSASGAEVLIFKVGDTARVPFYVANADEQGRYRLDRLSPGYYNLLATSDGLMLYRDSVALSPHSARTDTLGRPGSLLGRVQLEMGDNPRTVLVQAIGTDLFSNVDSTGNFSFAAVPAGVYTLRAVTTLQDYTPTFARVVARSDSITVLRDPIRLIYTGSQPRIFRPDGYPAAGVTVKILRADNEPGSEVRRCLTDWRGMYSLADLPVGRYNLLAMAGDLALFRDSVLLAPGVVRVDTMRHARAIRGRVELQYGDSPGNVLVRANGTGLYCTTDSSGAFVFPQMAAGDYGMTISPPLGYAPMTIRVHAFDDSAVVLGDAIRPTYLGAPPVKGVRAAYDTLAGSVHLAWSGGSSFTSYRIFREQSTPSGAKVLGPESWTTSDSTFVDTVFHTGRSFTSEDLLEATLIRGGAYRVCGILSDGSEGRCASVPMTVVPAYRKARQTGVRWTRIGAFPAKTPNDFNYAKLQVQSGGDSIWIFFQPQWHGCVQAWKSADGVQWHLVTDSLPIRVDWLNGDWDNMLNVYPTPQAWNDTLWAFRSSGDTLQLVGSVDAISWNEVPLPRTYVMRQAGSLIFKPSLLATPAGLEVWVTPVGTSVRVPPGCRRNARGEWETGMDGLGVNPLFGGTFGSVEFAYVSTESDTWRLHRDHGSSQFQTATSAWIEKASELTGTARRPIPISAELGSLVELGGLMYLSGHDQTYSPSTGSRSWATIFATAPSGSSWWSIDLPEEWPRLGALSSWKGHLLLVAEDGGIWLGEPGMQP